MGDVRWLSEVKWGKENALSEIGTWDHFRIFEEKYDNQQEEKSRPGQWDEE